jgi:Pentapeptide repeats (8 copies)
MRWVSAFLRRYLPIILAVLILLAIVVVLWIFSALVAQWLRSVHSFDAVTFLQDHLLAVGSIVGCLLILALIWLPKWQAARPGLTPQAQFEAENEARKTFAEIVGGAALLAGLYFTWSSLEVSREGQVTERFTKAIDQLGAVNERGEKQLEIRLGGIYALERIARDSPKDYWPIMEVLTAYVRENAPWPAKLSKDMSPQQDHPSLKGDPAAAQVQPPPKLATDIQTILTVLGRRDRTYEKKGQHLNLANTDLRGANLWEADLQETFLAGVRLQGADLGRARLQGAFLEEAHLQDADLRGADLQGASLRRAHLQDADLMQVWLPGADLWGANLQGARLFEANLQGARLRQAQLQGADLERAQMQRASLLGAQLEGARNLTVEQLSIVRTLYQAHLDPPLLEKIQQQYPQLLEESNL